MQKWDQANLYKWYSVNTTFIYYFGTAKKVDKIVLVLPMKNDVLASSIPLSSVWSLDSDTINNFADRHEFENKIK